jgi:hypothetical protein
MDEAGWDKFTRARKRLRNGEPLPQKTVTLLAVEWSRFLTAR